MRLKKSGIVVMIILNRLLVIKTLKVITKSASLEYLFTEELPYREIKAASCTFTCTFNHELSTIIHTTPGTQLVTVTIRATVIIVNIHCRMHLPRLRRLTHRLLLELYPLGCQLAIVVIQPCQSTMAAYYHSPGSSHASQWGLAST